MIHACEYGQTLRFDRALEPIHRFLWFERAENGG